MSRAGLRIRVDAFAKINLSLRVLGARSDGYHELRTVFQSIALHDTLTLERAHGPFRITCDDPSCPVDATNLVWRAAERVWRAGARRGVVRDLVVRLNKRIPIGAGLGGGSSDAAATLRACSKLWGVTPTRDELVAMAADLGADVPYFLLGGRVLGLGRGDQLFRLVEAPPAWVVLGVPEFRISTKEAYAWFDERPLDSPQSSAPDRGSTCAQALGLPSGELCNDLQSTVTHRHPEVRRVIDALEKAGARYAAMSGSGSAVFGLFSSRVAAKRAAARLGDRSLRVVLTRTINRGALASV